MNEVWQALDTAPRDGTRVLLFLPFTKQTRLGDAGELMSTPANEIVVGWWEASGEHWATSAFQTNGAKVYPSLWCPSPVHPVKSDDPTPQAAVAAFDTEQ